MKSARSLTVVLMFCVACIGASVSHAQTEKFPSAPKPTQLVAAKKVFLSNASNLGGIASDQLYDQIYAALQNLSRFTLVGAPQDADLIVKITVKEFLYSARVIDPRTHTTLWTVSEFEEPAARAATLAKNQQAVIDRLVADIARVASPPPA